MTNLEKIDVRSLFRIEQPNFIGYSAEQVELMNKGFNMALNKAYEKAKKLELLPKPYLSYEVGQFKKLLPNRILSGENGIVKMKLVSDKGDTNYLNLTDLQLSKIALLITGEDFS